MTRWAAMAALLFGLATAGCPCDIGPHRGVVDVDEAQGDAGIESGELALLAFVAGL